MHINSSFFPIEHLSRDIWLSQRSGLLEGLYVQCCFKVVPPFVPYNYHLISPIKMTFSILELGCDELLLIHHSNPMAHNLHGQGTFSKAMVLHPTPISLRSLYQRWHKSWVSLRCLIVSLVLQALLKKRCVRLFFMLTLIRVPFFCAPSALIPSICLVNWKL
jgi:hypothetical protein